MDTTLGESDQRSSFSDVSRSSIKPHKPKETLKGKKHVLGEKQPLNANAVVRESLQAIICRRRKEVVHSQQGFQAPLEAVSSPRNLVSPSICAPPPILFHTPCPSR